MVFLSCIAGITGIKEEQNMKKKALALILALCMVLAPLSLRAEAAQFRSLPTVQAAPMGKIEPAQPQKDTYSIEMTATGPGRAELYGNAAGAGESIYFLADPEPGYKVSFEKCGYYQDPEKPASPIRLIYVGSNIYELVMPAGDVVLDLEFVKITTDSHKVKLSATVGGTAIVDQSSAKAGESIFVKTTANPGYTMTGIQAKSKSGTHKCYPLGSVSGGELFEIFMPGEDLEITVTFTAIVQPISVTSVTPMGGRVSLSAATGTIGQTVTLICLPDEGYRVAQITGAKVTNMGDGFYNFQVGTGPVALQVLFLRHENPFLDVNETHFYYDAVLWALNSGVTNGVDATHFGSMSVCNRAQVVTFLWRAAGSPAPTATEIPFTDVESGTWYTDAVLWAVENGITTGLTETTFGPGEICNRAQAVTFLYRASGSPEVKDVNNPFADVSEGQFFHNAVLWAVENGITTGTTDTAFTPLGDCFRSQVVTFLYRSDRPEG